MKAIYYHFLALSLFLISSEAAAGHALTEDAKVETTAPAPARAKAAAAEPEGEEEQGFKSPWDAVDKLSYAISGKAEFGFILRADAFGMMKDVQNDPEALKAGNAKLISGLKKIEALIDEGVINERFKGCSLTVGEKSSGPSAQCEMALPWDLPIEKMRELFQAQTDPQGMMRESRQIALELKKASGLGLNFAGITLAELKANKDRLLKFLTSPEIEKRGILNVTLNNQGGGASRDGQLALNLIQNDDDWKKSIEGSPIGAAHTLKMARNLSSKEGLSDDEKAFLTDISIKMEPQAKKEAEARETMRASIRMQELFGASFIGAHGMKPEDLEKQIEKWKAVPSNEMQRLKDLDLGVNIFGRTEPAFISTGNVLMLPPDAATAEVLASLPTAAQLAEKQALYRKRIKEVSPRLNVGKKVGSLSFYAHSMSYEQALEGMSSLETILNQGYRLKSPLHVVHFYKSKENPINFWNTGMPGKQTQVLMDVGIKIEQLPAEVRDKFFEKLPAVALEAMPK